MSNKQQNKIQNIFMVFFIITLVIISWLIYKTHTPLSAIQKFPIIDKPTESEIIDPFFEYRLIPIPSKIYPKSGYSITLLNKDNLLAFWAAPMNEIKSNLAINSVNLKILQSRFENKTWSDPQTIISTHKLSTFNQKYIRNIENHAVYEDNAGVIHLFIIFNNIIDWAGNNISDLISKDDGRNWALAGKAIPSLFFSKNQLTHSNMINLEDGFYLPIDSQFFFKYIPNHYESLQLLRFNSNNNFIEQIPLSLMVTNKLSMSTFYSYSKAIFQLDNDSIFMVYNIDLSKLGIAKSIDGVHWHNIKVLENSPGNTFTNSSIQIKNGSINLFYVWNSQYIKHLRFNKEWLMGPQI